MSAPRKVSDEAILGCIRAGQRSVRIGPSQREIATQLGLAHATVRARLRALRDAGEIIESAEHGYLLPGESE